MGGGLGGERSGAERRKKGQKVRNIIVNGFVTITRIVLTIKYL